MRAASEGRTLEDLLSLERCLRSPGDFDLERDRCWRRELDANCSSYLDMADWRWASLVVTMEISCSGRSKETDPDGR